MIQTAGRTSSSRQSPGCYAQQQPDYYQGRQSLGPVVGAAAVGYMAGRAMEHHHHRPTYEEKWDNARAMVASFQQPQSTYQQPQVTESVDRPWWGYQDIYFDPYNSDGGHHFGNHSW